MYNSYIQFTFNLQVYLWLFFKLQLEPKIILHLLTCRIIWMLGRMKKRNSDQPGSIHQDHLVDLIEVLKDTAAQLKPK